MEAAQKYMPLAFNPARMERLRQWCFTPDYAVDRLPGYAPEGASNPFLIFHALLVEAQFTLMGFVKGPVC